MLRVKDVDYQGDYRLALTFSDGVHKVVDLEPHLHGEVFGSLRDKEQFIQYGERAEEKGEIYKHTVLNSV